MSPPTLNSNEESGSENEQDRRTGESVRSSLTPSSQNYLLKRTLSSPTGHSIVEFLTTRDRRRRSHKVRSNQENLPSCLSTPVKLANRQDSCSSTGPKFLALGDGLISVEPRVRTSLSRGTPVRSRSVCFGTPDTPVEEVTVNAFRRETERLLEKFAQTLLSRKSKKARRRDKKVSLSAGYV